MRVAVTGASGHIGNCLVRELKKQGAGIKVLVHDFRNDLDEMGVEIIEGNLLEPGSLVRLCKGVDVVFHLAARIVIDNRSPELVFETNITGTKNIINAALNEGVKKFIHFSSIDAFEAKPSVLKLDENSSLIESREIIYGFTKAEGERAVLEAVKEGLNAVIISPTAVIGPYDCRGSLLGQALLEIYQAKLPLLIEGGYNWVDVRDVVAGSIQAIESGRKGEKYIISGKYYSLKELSSMINRISGSRNPIIVPVFMARLALPFFQVYSAVTKNDQLYTRQSLDLLVNPALRNVSSEKAGRELAYEPRQMEQTLKDTFTWYKENKYIS